MAAWLQAKVRECALGLRPRLYDGSVSVAQRRLPLPYAATGALQVLCLCVYTYIYIL